MKKVMTIMSLLIATHLNAQLKNIDCEVFKNGALSSSDKVEISLDKPLFTRIKKITNEDGSIIAKKEEFVTDAYISSWKIDRKCLSPCSCSVSFSDEEYRFTATCSGVSAQLLIDLKKMQGMYFEEFRPTNTSRSIAFAKCVHSSDQ